MLHGAKQPHVAGMRKFWVRRAIWCSSRPAAAAWPPTAEGHCNLRGCTWQSGNGSSRQLTPPLLHLLPSPARRMCMHGAAWRAAATLRLCCAWLPPWHCLPGHSVRQLRCPPLRLSSRVTQHRQAHAGCAGPTRACVSRAHAKAAHTAPAATTTSAWRHRLLGWQPRERTPPRASLTVRALGVHERTVASRWACAPPALLAAQPLSCAACSCMQAPRQPHRWWRQRRCLSRPRPAQPSLQPASARHRPAASPLRPSRPPQLLSRLPLQLLSRSLCSTAATPQPRSSRPAASQPQLRRQQARSQRS